MPFHNFQKLHGKLQHVCQILPSLKGFMTPLNAQLKLNRPTVSLGKKSELREIIEQSIAMIDDLESRPTHALELAAFTLPHSYGYDDSSAEGAGGVWLPCTTNDFHPIVWRLLWPADIQKEVRDHHGKITNSDVELAAVFLAMWVLFSITNMKHQSSFLGSDNMPTVSWSTRMSTKSPSKIPDRFLRLMACLQRGNQAGPTDVTYQEGKTNKMADFSSRSWTENKFPDNHAFITEFNSRFPLPAPFTQWHQVHIPPKVAEITISILRNKPLETTLLKQTLTGVGGLNSAKTTQKTSGCAPCKETTPPLAADAKKPSWPLVNASGVVDGTTESVLVARRSKERYANLHSS